MLSAGTSTVELAGAVTVPGDVKQLWGLGGFEAGGHAQMWQEFNEHWRKPLALAMDKLAIQPLAGTDSQAGLALAMDAGPLRYVTVTADAAGTHSNDFQRPRGLAVSFEGTGFTVRDLAHQETLKTTTQDGRTLVSLDLVTEPATVLALYKQPPERVEIQHAADPRLGAQLVFAPRCARPMGPAWAGCPCAASCPARTVSSAAIGSKRRTASCVCRWRRTTRRAIGS